jgi:integrase
MGRPPLNQASSDAASASIATGTAPHFTFHGTRHAHLTEVLRKVGKAGAKAVSQRAGHADIMTTLSVYQAVFESDDANLAVA